MIGNGNPFTANYQNGLLDLDAGQRTFTVAASNDPANPVSLTINATITNGSLRKAGAGLLVLSGNNTLQRRDGGRADSLESSPSVPHSIRHRWRQHLQRYTAIPK